MIWCCRAAPMTRTWWSCSTPFSCPWRDNDEQYHLCSCSWRDNDKDSCLCSCSWRDNDEGHRLRLCSWRDKDKDHLLYDSWLFAQITIHVHDGTMMLTIASMIHDYLLNSLFMSMTGQWCWPSPLWFVIICSNHCSSPWRDNDEEHRLCDSWWNAYTYITRNKIYLFATVIFTVSAWRLQYHNFSGFSSPWLLLWLILSSLWLDFHDKTLSPCSLRGMMLCSYSFHHCIFMI